MKKIHILLLYVAIISNGCTPSPVVRSFSESDKSNAKVCKSSLEPLQKEIIEKKLNESPYVSEKRTSDLVAEDTAQFYQDILNSYRDAVLVEKWDSLSKAEKVKYESLYIFNDCSEYVVKNALNNYLAQSRISGAYRYDKARENDLQASLTSMNKEIDGALNDLMSDYKKKAKRHWATTGAGHVKVDAFEMPDGEVVYCKTIITNGGKSVDCS